MLRTESLQTLSGRTTLWAAAYETASRSPWVGHGFTFGTDALRGAKASRASHYIQRIESTGVRAGTFHNGYIQSVLDIGVIGSVFYLGVIALALWRILIRDTQRVYGAVAFVLVFGAVANFGKTFVYSAAVFDSILFWASAVVALNFTPASKADLQVSSGANDVVAQHTLGLRPRQTV